MSIAKLKNLKIYIFLGLERGCIPGKEDEGRGPTVLPEAGAGVSFMKPGSQL